MPDQSVWSPSQIAAQRLAKRHSSYYVSLNLWPFVGVMVALVVLFMPWNGVDLPVHGIVDLPLVLHPSFQPSALREDAIRITVERGGNLYVGHSQITYRELSGLIQTSVLAGSEKKVFLNVDARAKYGDVKVVLDQVRLAGISQVCFLAEKGEPRVAKTEPVR